MKIGQSNTLKDEVYQRRRVEDIARAVNGALEFGAPLENMNNIVPSTAPPATTNPNVVPAGSIPSVPNNPNSNMSGTWVNTQTPAAGQAFTVQHNLGRIPTGILVFAVDQPGAVIHAVDKASWTTTTATFSSNMTGVNLQGFVT